MNYVKLILIGIISAFVALLTSMLGVTGTIIGSVISSVLYNMLTEVIDKPASKAKFSSNFEWEIAYVFPLVVIALIQLLLILALLSEAGILPGEFLSVYLLIQDVADNNLYRILGLALIVMSVYPIVLKPENVKKVHGIILAVIGLVFLARGFVDYGSAVTELYNPIFDNFDFQIAVIAFIAILIVIVRILILATSDESDSKVIERRPAEDKSIDNIHKVYPSKRQNRPVRVNNKKYNKTPKREDVPDVRFKKHVGDNQENTDVSRNSGINESSGDIQFESNDLLDEYKK